jgi:hypothetical protein
MKFMLAMWKAAKSNDTIHKQKGETMFQTLLNRLTSRQIKLGIMDKIFKDVNGSNQSPTLTEGAEEVAVNVNDPLSEDKIRELEEEMQTYHEKRYVKILYLYILICMILLFHFIAKLPTIRMQWSTIVLS